MGQTRKKYICNFGDVNWVENGGLLLFKYEKNYSAFKINPCVDFTEGTMELYDPDMTWEIFQFDIDEMKVKNGQLVDSSGNKEWYSDDIDSIASFHGENIIQFIYWITSNNVKNRLRAYEMIANYWGYENLDSYPLCLNAKELKRMFRSVPGIDSIDLRFLKKGK